MVSNQNTFVAPPPDALEFFASSGTVGVTGHRLNRLTKQTESQLTSICKTLFEHTHPECLLLSCLAEGVDTIVAEQWPSSRCLSGLLPTHKQNWREAMANVMDPTRFDALSARAEITILDDSADMDFVALSEELVARSDRIFAVWDGLTGKPGGTGSVVAQARAMQMPVLHLAFLKTGFSWQ